MRRLACGNLDCCTGNIGGIGSPAGAAEASAVRERLWRSGNAFGVYAAPLKHGGVTPYTWRVHGGWLVHGWLGGFGGARVGGRQRDNSACWCRQCNMHIKIDTPYTLRVHGVWVLASHPAGPQCPLDRKHQFKCPARFESTQGLGGGQVGDGGNNRQGWTGEVTSRDGLGDQTARWEDNRGGDLARGSEQDRNNEEEEEEIVGVEISSPTLDHCHKVSIASGFPGFLFLLSFHVVWALCHQGLHDVHLLGEFGLLEEPIAIHIVHKIINETTLINLDSNLLIEYQN
ncbi:hypothetical protein FIBSPDRAFT_884264 [Athelia psychrophila]|uniref:Uncharacterized protein n=1 Tax=Athelia psychrophila TaxID=1759441 RepID=A0A166T8V8_9AGAM|nr:hypothetical protein FIBSPDRAFT_884264 [Fibularhizoctonia sp. CBS 109695]